MSNYEFTMALRMRHPSIEPAEITRALGIVPQHTWKAGDARHDSSGTRLEGTYRESYWVSALIPSPQLSSESATIEGVLLQTLAQLRRSFGFLADFSAHNGLAELEISIYAREEFRVDLLAESLALLGRLGLAVSLEVHPHPYAPDTETAQDH